MAKQKIEMEKVTIEIPKAIMDFLRSVEVRPEEYLQYSLIDAFRADIECSSGMWGYSEIFKRYDLAPVFKAFDVTYTNPDC